MATETVKISVLMSVYNERRQWLESAVRSILDQSERDFEFLIVVDNPALPDDCRTFLEQSAEADERIRLFWNEKNIGLAACMNLALSKARGEYAARMDADDISMPERFSRELAFLEQTGADVVSSQMQPIDEEGRKIDKTVFDCPNVEVCLPYTNYIVHPSVLMKIQALRSVGGYRNFRTSQDYDLWLRLLQRHCKIVILSEVLLQYRIGSSSTTSRKGMEQFFTAKYQRLLYKQRKARGSDEYSEENYQRYLQKKRITPARTERFMRAQKEMDLAACSDGLTRTLYHYAKAFFLLPEFVSTRIYIKIARTAALRRAG